MHAHGTHGGGQHDALASLEISGWLLVSVLLILLGAYLVGVLRLRHRGVSWPVARSAACLLGTVAALVALVGPLAQRSHHDFAAHMAGHVLLGMLAPLLLALAAPVSLALRVLTVSRARRLTRVLRSTPVELLTQPLVAGALSVGGLWVLYRTDLYATMHESMWLHLAVHAHVLAAGYLFTVAVLGGPDPAPHRPSAPWRAAALVAAIAAHNILAKVIYAHPPAGVPADQARAGAELMYYAGAPIEVALLVLVCRPWLTRPTPRCACPSTESRRAFG